MTKTDSTSHTRALYRRVDGAVTRIERLLAGGLLLLAVAIILVDILLRATIAYALPWAGEATRYAIIWLVFIASGIGARHGAHISIDFLAEMASRKVAIQIARTGAVISAGTCILLTVFGVQLTTQMRAFGQTSPSLEWPMWIIYLSVPIGAALMALRFTQSAFELSDTEEARSKVALSAA
ncbi:C4-dicarboxylate transporter, DctQ subunit [Roseivivax lentus]|uniref:TRAP transporter small permease protein n=1 Tax=Roseivivax lentus TaxID=633194 RepID=A0A1N7KRW5_9RHOB|nr:TRAP transporter small permease [Roseivivax lentus]SIS64295.1 C4-dicarboxylate transporter, DctQ subunit [Roseivivax lentus]